MFKPSLLFLCLLFGLIPLGQAAPAPAPSKDPAELLRQGLFEEEANRDLDKAASAYAGVVEVYDAQRTLAATALFRLAEVRAAQGNKIAATTLYQRVLTEFPNQDPLAKLSRDRLAALGIPAPDAATQAVKSVPSDEEGKLLARYQETVQMHFALPEFNGNTDDAPFLGKTPMIHAAGQGWTRLLTFMLDHRADVNGWSNTGDPLRAAAAAGRLEAVELLLSRGAFIDRADQDGWTALHAACLNRHPEVVSLLLDKGAATDVFCTRLPDLDKIPIHPWSPQQPTDLTPWKDIPLGSPLLVAVRNGDDDIVTRLLDHGADANFYAKRGENDRAKLSPLLFALRTGHEGAARLLLAHGAKVDFATPDGLTVLDAAAMGTPTLVATLLDQGTPQTADSNGWTPLFYGVYFGGSRRSYNEAKGEEILLPLPDFTVRLPAYVAAWDALAAHGANVNARDRRGNMLIHYIQPDDYHPTEVLGWLLAHGADINARDQEGRTPLQLFCSRGFSNPAREGVAGAMWLLEHGADAEVRDAQGRTPLFASGALGRRLGGELARKFILPKVIARSLGTPGVVGVLSDEHGPQNPVECKPQAEFDAPPSLPLLLRVVLFGSSYGQLEVNIHHAAPGGGEWPVVSLTAKSPLSAQDVARWPALRRGDVVEVSAVSPQQASTVQPSVQGNLSQELRRLSADHHRLVTVQLGDRVLPLVLADPAADSTVISSLISQHLYPGGIPPGTHLGTSSSSPVVTSEDGSLILVNPNGSNQILQAAPGTAWTPVATPLPSWTLSELVAHLAQGEPRLRLDAATLERTASEGKQTWPLDLRATAGTESQTDDDGQPTGVRKLAVFLADGDRLVLPLLPAADPVALAARRQGIRFSGPGDAFSQRVFTRPPDDSASHTLGELLMQAYLSSMVIPNPNLSGLIIHRLKDDSGVEEGIPVDLTQTILASLSEYQTEKVRQGDIPLQWGDRVEISAIEGVEPAKWQELSRTTQGYLKQALGRTIKTTLNGQPTGTVPPREAYLEAVFKDYTAEGDAFPLRFSHDPRRTLNAFTALRLLEQFHVDLDTMTRFTIRRGEKTFDYDLKKLREVDPWLAPDAQVNIQQLSP